MCDDRQLMAVLVNRSMQAFLPFLMQSLQDDDGLHGNASYILLCHVYGLRVPRIPQARAPEIHHLPDTTTMLTLIEVLHQTKCG